jgi:hypothetical protein
LSGDDRPKKSWRELDAARDKGGGGGRRRDPSERDREKASKSQAYSAYKSQLDKLFKPGGAQLPEHMRAALGPQSDESKTKRALLEALSADPGEATLRAMVEAQVALPPEPRLLTGLLDVRDEALLRTVLQALLELVEVGKKPNRMLLIQRLEAVKNRSESRETVELADMVRAALD